MFSKICHDFFFLSQRLVKRLRQLLEYRPMLANPIAMQALGGLYSLKRGHSTKITNRNAKMPAIYEAISSQFIVCVSLQFASISCYRHRTDLRFATQGDVELIEDT